MVDIELCPECRELGYCWFAVEADKFAKIVPSGGNQALFFDKTCKAHFEIAEARHKAREKRCPNLNWINPDYQGKELL